MALTEEQAAQLAALEAERDAPEPRTETGLAGVLHTLLDVASGHVPHLSGEAWAALHHEAEALATGHGHPGPEPEPEREAEPFGTETQPAG